MLESSYTFKYSDSPSETEKITNYFVEELAKSIPKILAYTKYTYSYTQMISVSKKITGNGTKTELFLNYSLSNFKISDVSEAKYKSFNISDILIPEFLNCTLEISSSNGILLKSVDIKKSALIDGKFSLSQLNIPDSLANSIKDVKISNVKLYYGDISKQKFDTRIKYINNYFSSEFKIQDGLTKLQKINIDYVDMIKVYDINLDEVESLVADLEGQKYPETLNLQFNDPIGFVSKLEGIKTETKRMRIILNQMMSNLDKVLYNKGLEFLAASDTTKAIEYFEKAIITNPFYAPANYQLAKVFLYQNKLEQSGKIINSITSKMNPDQSTLKLVIILAKDLYKAFLINSMEFIKLEDYHSAITLLEKGKAFCAGVTVIACDDLIQKYMSQAKYGIYNSFLTVSEKALDKEIFDLAELYLLKAKTYQAENSADIISSTEANNMLKLLASAYVKKGFLFNNLLKFDTALVMLKKAKQLCVDYNLNNCNEKLEAGIITATKGNYHLMIKKASALNSANDVENAELMIAKAKAYQKENNAQIPDASSADSMLTIIKTTRYYKNINDGRTYLTSSMSSKALDKFIEARELEKTYKVTKDKSLDSLIRVSAKPYILALLEKASVKVWGNEISKARTIADSAAAMQSNYLLKSDSTINNAFINLNVLIGKKICSNAQESYNENYRNAFTSIKLKEFNTAIDYFNACIDTVAKNTTCKLSDSTAIAAKIKYLKASEYQNLLKESKVYSTNSNYKLALEKYMEAGTYFTENKIDQFSIDHLSLQKYISFQKDNNFVYYCSKYYLNLEKYQDAIFFLDLLRIKGYPSNYTFDIQEILAKKLSTIDFATNPKQKPQKSVLTNISADVYYKYFRKAYIANWKVLKKETSFK